VIGGRLRRTGVLGINRRNRDYIGRWNERRRFPAVDDKLRTKQLCEASGVATPELLGAISSHSELRSFAELLGPHDAFAVKPARGCQGNGILIVAERRGCAFHTSGGRVLGLADVRHRISEILSGCFSLAGQPDAALVEELLTVHPALARACASGVPDIRVVLFRGLPVMAMARLPSRRSRGRANLHQGALGAGIRLSQGRLATAVQGDRFVDRHPDTGERLIGLELPHFRETLVQAVRVSRCAGLGYVGVDLVLDEKRGPVVLELNARPGLSIQLANRAGLLPRLEQVERLAAEDRGVDERVELARSLASEWERSP
jgi:alpha-L-glutamate ligase-like protein